MATTEKFFAAAELIEDELVNLIRDSLNAEYLLRGQAATPDTDPSLQRAHLLDRAKKDMQRLTNMEKVRYP